MHSPYFVELLMMIPTTSVKPTHMNSSAGHIARRIDGDRRNDLDALRAFAMLLGIFYHAALSLADGFPWFVQDPAANRTMYVFQSAVHGFRMPLFFIVSGFFTAMLWRNRGTAALLSHRFRRVFLPCLVGLFTVVPISNWVIGKAMERSGSQRNASIQKEASDASIWAAMRRFDSRQVETFLERGVDTEALHPEYRITTVAWAALVGDVASTRVLLDAGCDPNARSEDQNTALHAAAFLGRYDIATLLMDRGADVNAQSRTGETPLAAARGDLSIVPFIASLLALEFDLADVQAGRKLVIAELERRGAKDFTSPIARPQTNENRAGINWDSMIGLLMYFPIFSFLWFLWFLWWYVVLFALAMWILSRRPWPIHSWNWVISPWSIGLLVLLTTIPTSQFDSSGWLFGPDTSVGILPMMHVFGFYAIFFVFGLAYFQAEDSLGKLGSSWRWLLPISLLVIFPLALEFTTGIFNLRDAILPKDWHRTAAVLGQSLFAWTTSLGCIGLFRSCLAKENAWVKYMAYASYWLYLTHLPLVVCIQMAVVPYSWPAFVKVLVISMTTILLLLAIYHVAVRSTWIGVFLNGKRLSSQKPAEYPSGSTVEGVA
jgi:hypothetical protein